MKTNEPKATGRRLPAGAGAFTLTELLVVVGIVAMLSAVLLSAAFTSKERVLRAHCVNNLRQIGVGMSVYATEANGYAPICGWPQGQNPWQTYEACRVDPATGTNLIRGYESLGMLFQTKAVSGAKIFYCPSLSSISSNFNDNYYTTAPTGWPSTPAGSGDDNVRTGYNYYPQLRVTERVNTIHGIFSLPRLTYTSVVLQGNGDPLSALKLVTPAKWTELDPKKSITTDMVNSTAQLSHRASGAVAGLNALFPDGHVVFQNARTDTRTTVNSPWYFVFWTEPEPGNSTPETFRIIMSEWQP
jgi:type II secretory pathway pseudopilin PulG